MVQAVSRWFDRASRGARPPIAAANEEFAPEARSAKLPVVDPGFAALMLERACERARRGLGSFWACLVRVDGAAALRGLVGETATGSIFEDVGLRMAPVLQSGDEFWRLDQGRYLVVGAGRSPEALTVLCTLLRRQVARRSFLAPGGDVRISISVGAVQCDFARGSWAGIELVDAVVDALHAAEAAGEGGCRLRMLEP